MSIHILSRRGWGYEVCYFFYQTRSFKLYQLWISYPFWFVFPTEIYALRIILGAESSVLRRSESHSIELTHSTRISGISERDVLAIYYLYLTRMSLGTQLLYSTEYIFQLCDRSRSMFFSLKEIPFATESMLACHWMRLVLRKLWKNYARYFVPWKCFLRFSWQNTGM